MSPREPHTSTTSGLRLIPCRGEVGFRVAKRAYPVASAPLRTADDLRDEWGRFDTVGSTLYVAETARSAYTEVLSPLKQANGTVNSLQADAESMGMTIEEFLEEIASEWGERNFMGLGAVPAKWRELRAIHQILLPSAGWWVDIEHPDSIAAINDGLAGFLAGQGIPALDTSHLRGANRYVTTMIATLTQSLTVDDGTTPVGIHFGSRHGGAWCKAIWLHEGLELIPLGPEPILVTDPDLAAAADNFRIRVF